MCITGWMIGRFQIKGWVEVGVHEGETVGYFSELVPGKIGMGCDINAETLEIARGRYPWLQLKVASSVEYLREVDAPRPSVFYFDTTWGSERPLGEELAIVHNRFPEGILYVNNVDLDCGQAGCHKVPPAVLQQYGRVIVPDYSVPVPVAGYGIVVPDGEVLPPMTHWKVLPKS
jgi:hypothetical protein